MRSFLLAALVLVPAAARSAVVCPWTRDGQRLHDVMLFDGPPAEMAILMAEQRGRRVTWDIGDIVPAGRRAHLVCGYGGGAPKLEVEVPAAAQACTFTATAQGRVGSAIDCR